MLGYMNKIGNLVFLSQLRGIGHSYLANATLDKQPYSGNLLDLSCRLLLQKKWQHFGENTALLTNV